MAIQRGNNRQICFTSDTDIATHSHWLNEGAEKFDVLIHGWGFITNHVHLLVIPQQDNFLSKMMQYIELNPVRAGLVADPGDYRWSSYRGYFLGSLGNPWF